MHEIVVPVEVAAEQLGRLVEEVHARGQTVVLTRAGQPVARLVPLPLLHTDADLAAYLNCTDVEPPLPAPPEPLPLEGVRPLPPVVHAPPLPEIKPPVAHEAAHAVKRKKPPLLLALSLGVALLGGAMLVLVATLAVRFMLAPAPVPANPPHRSSVRDTSRLAPPHERLRAARG